ncbi:hypothetical protein [Polaribacter vadi]|uniref:hypothetical protein n=1 Tax=Polaribacter vadi TaxID=1774273 RepID=UPI0030EE2395
MKTKKILFIVVFLVLNVKANSQSVGQDAKGYSSIVIPSSNIYLDITEKIGSFSFYTEFRNGDLEYDDFKSIELAFEKKLKNTNHLSHKEIEYIKSFLIDSIYEVNEELFKNNERSNFFTTGLELSAKLEDGVSAIFSEGKFAKSNSFNALIGYNFLRKKHNTKDEYLEGFIRNKDSVNFNEHQLLQSENKILKELLNLSKNQHISPIEYTTLSKFTKKNNDATINFLNSQITYLKVKEKKTKTDNKDDLEKIRFLAIENKSLIKNIIRQTKLDTNNIDLQNIRLEYLALKQHKIVKDSADKKVDTSRYKIDSLIKLNKLNNLNTSLNSKRADSLVLKSKEKKQEFIFLSIQKNIDNLTSIISKTPFSEKLKKEILNGLGQDYYSEKGWNSILGIINKYNSQLTLSNIKQDEDYTSITDIFKERIKLLTNQTKYKKDLDFYKNKINYYNKSLIYARGGYHGASFKRDKENAATNLDERLEDIDFDGYSLELGYTHQYRVRNYIGLSLGLSRLYNTDTLKSKKYIFQQVDPTISNGNFVTNQEVTAYKGVFDPFLRFSVNFDYVHLISLKEVLNAKSDTKNSDMYLSLNPYIRHYGYSGSETLKNNTTFGLGLHAFNSKDNKLAGGIYVESSDTFGSNKFTPNKFGKRITIGIIAKFSFKGLKPESK